MRKNTKELKTLLFAIVVTKQYKIKQNRAFQKTFTDTYLEGIALTLDGIHEKELGCETSQPRRF